MPSLARTLTAAALGTAGYAAALWWLRPKPAPAPAPSPEVEADRLSDAEQDALVRELTAQFG